MPIEYRIDHERRLVVARVRGVLTSQELFDYQQAVWSRPDVVGYDELVDMTPAEGVADASVGGVQRLASLSAEMDHPKMPTRFAIVAPQDLAFGLGRMYEAFRSMEKQSNKQVEVFRTEAEALVFLGIKGPLPKWGSET